MTSGRRSPRPGPPRHEEPGQGSAPEEASGAEAAGVRLRPMTQADVPAVAQLEAELFGGEAWSPALLADELAAARQGDQAPERAHVGRGEAAARVAAAPEAVEEIQSLVVAADGQERAVDLGRRPQKGHGRGPARREAPDRSPRRRYLSSPLQARLCDPRLTGP